MDTYTNILSLCSGGGGLELGLELACEAFRTVCYVEREAYCCEILAERMEEKVLDEAPIWTDLRTFDGKPWGGVVDCVTGGYPCQPFSVAGKQLGEDDDRHLWPEIARIVREVEPGMCFFENVAGHLNFGFDTVLADLRAMGYRVAAGLFTAAEVGATHKRERLFILANSGRRRHAAQQRHGRKLQEASHQLANTASGCQSGCSKRQRQGQSGRSGTILADASQCRVEGIGTSGQQITQASAGQELSGRNGLPVFPLGPSDLEGWREVLEINPSLEPALCRMADGMAYRVDRLRMLGNGVVPLQAAYAFVSLWSALQCI